MVNVNELTQSHLINEYPKFNPIRRSPIWLRECRWDPKYKFQTSDKKKILLVDMILSGTIPKYQYSKIVQRLLAEHRELRVIVVTLKENYEDNEEIKKFCEKYGIGLKIVIPGLGLQTIIKTDFDRNQELKTLPLEDGWFPAAILQQARGLKRLSFSEVIDGFIVNLEVIRNDEQATIDLVHNTIDTLLRYHPSFTGQFGQFMKLSLFEKLLRINNPDSSDHVLHSFRVFLAGCPVIDKFYNKFCSLRYCTIYTNNKKSHNIYLGCTTWQPNLLWSLSRNIAELSRKKRDYLRYNIGKRVISQSSKAILH